MSNQENKLQCCVKACENPLDQSYWDVQWMNKTTRWDIGDAAPAITTYLEQYENKDAAILIPGCGNAYEAEYLIKSGFTNITLIDISPKAISIIKEKFAFAPLVKILCCDFFEHQGNYDLIIEQTFFCAIPPNRRNDYAMKTASMLNANGKIIGLLFNKVFETQGPPFGGSKDEYVKVLEPYFEIKTLENCYNSILPRANSEVFINLIKK